jgi:hypothetical protein
MRNKNIWRYLFILACLLAVLLEVVPGRSPQIDEEFFKSPGRHWAATGQFAAPEIVGRVDVTPGLDEIFFAQPPLYSFLFGVYTKIVGFGPHRCILFDALVHVLLAALIIALAHREFDLPAKYAYLLGTLVLVLGTRGRPDELGMCFAIAGMLAWTLDLTTSRRAVLSGAMFGVCGATSLGACLFLLPLGLLVGYLRAALNLRTALRWTLACSLVGLLCIAPILVHHPGPRHEPAIAYMSPQLGLVVTGQSRWTAVLLSLVNGALFAARFGRPMLAVVFGSLAVIALCFRQLPRHSAGAYTARIVVVVAVLVGQWFILPGKYTYLWFFAPWLLALSAAMLARCYAGLRSSERAMVVVTLVLCILTAVEPYIKGEVVVLSLPHEQSFDANMSRVRALIPAGSHVATLEYWWALADRCQVFDPQFSHPKKIDIDYMIKSGNGSGRPGVGQAFAEYYESYAQENHFTVLEDDLNRERLKVGPLRLTNSAYGFGPLILARSTGRRGGSSTDSNINSQR